MDSSNYNPAPAWAVGAQLVALNYQTKKDPFLMANIGKFRENGSCGYVLKPPYLRDAGPESPPVLLTVHLISGQQLPKPGSDSSGEIIDPYISLTMIGIPEDTKEYRTATVNDNGFNPNWNEVFSFEVQNPDVAILSFKVWDEDTVVDDFIGYSSLPVSCLRTGLRTVGVFDINGHQDREYAFATLFVRITLEPLADKHARPHLMPSGKSVADIGNKSYTNTEIGNVYMSGVFSCHFLWSLQFLSPIYSCLSKLGFVCFT